jgi:hypothetical protein
MALGVLELILIGIIVLAAMRGRNWGQVALLIVCGLGLLLLVWGRARHESPSLQMTAIGPPTEWAAPAVSQMVVYDHGQLATHDFQSSGKTKISILLLIVIALCVCAVFVGVRRGHTIGIGLAAIISLAVLVLGTYSVRRVRQPMPPQVVWEHSPAVVQPLDIPGGNPAAEGVEPIDELWNRLNEPRIKLAAAPEPPVAAAATPTESNNPAPAQAAESSEAIDSATATQAPAESEPSLPANPPEPQSPHEAATTAVAETDELQSHADHATAEASSIPKPKWVETPPRLVGDVRRVVVHAGPYSTLDECYERLREEIRQAVRHRIEDLARASTGSPYIYAPELSWMRLSDDDIVRDLLVDQYVEPGEASFGSTKTAWGLLEFTDVKDGELLRAWRAYARRDGIKATTAISALVLGILGFVFGLLKVDTWTRGYYTKRLFIGVPAAIIAVVMLVTAMS